jgi:hypothetical protein
MNLLRITAGVEVQLVDREPNWKDDNEEEDFSVWAVDFDSTIKYDWDYVWHKHHPHLAMAIYHAGIEIISPILKWDSPQIWVPEEKHMVVVEVAVHKAFPEWPSEILWQSILRARNTWEPGRQFRT